MNPPRWSVGRSDGSDYTQYIIERDGIGVAALHLVPGAQLDIGQRWEGARVAGRPGLVLRTSDGAVTASLSVSRLRWHEVGGLRFPDDLDEAGTPPDLPDPMPRFWKLNS
jgi:hypothetical protein